MAKPLLLHARTEKAAAQLLKNPPQALLIYGPAGSGKHSFAKLMSSTLLGVEPAKLADYPYFMLVQKPDNKQEISIDAVREVTRQLNLKTVINAQKAVNRVVLIEDAHLASAEAQNALLKAIEEPPKGTVFILTAISDNSVLPTIASRAEKLPILPVNLAETHNYFGDLYEDDAIDSAWQLSDGSAGLLNALLEESQSHPLKQSVETAKRILSLNRYERLQVLDRLSANKADFKDVLDALARILASLHRSAINNGNDNQAKRLLATRKLLNSSLRSLEKNTSPRLVALDVVLKLPI